MNNEELRKVVDNVLRYLCWHKRRALLDLFPEETKEYRDQWTARDAFETWCHLDLDKQRKLVQNALNFYGGGE